MPEEREQDQQADTAQDAGAAASASDAAGDAAAPGGDGLGHAAAPEGDAASGGSAAAGGPAGGGERADDGERADGVTAGGLAAKRRRRRWREVVYLVAAAAVVTLLLKAFVLQVYQIPTASMENTLLTGDRVLVNRLSAHFGGFQRGEVVVFSGYGSWGNEDGTTESPPPGNPVVRFFDGVLSDIGLRSGGTYYIKRVIGLPGDHVACCKNGLLTVNGVQLHETGYLYPGSTAAPRSFSVVVPPGRLWVMGDNRDDSDDSLDHMLGGYPYQGTIPENQVVGRAFWIIWPFSQLGGLPVPATFTQAAIR